MPLADGPAMYFGGTIMTFALPYGAFIVSAIALFYLFRARHSSPKLRYLASAFTSSVATKEPGPVPSPPVSAADEASDAEVESQAQAEEEAEPEAEAAAEPTDEAEADADAETEAEAESESEK
jgi:hypothetical protein